jgi:peptidoglycan/LPS O-acetylase OafA/YrhL
MTFYAITPLCFRIWKRSAHREGLTAAAVLLSLGVCQVLTHEGYWYATDFFYRVPVFFLGLLIGFYGVANRKLTRGGLLFWLAVLAVGMGYFQVSQHANWIDWPIHFPLCHLFLFTTVPMCLILCLCFAYLPLGWLRRFLRLVGENSLEIYLLNVSLFALTTPLRDTVLPSPTHRLFYLVSFALNLGLGVALHRLVSRAVVILNQWRNSYAAKHPCCR